MEKMCKFLALLMALCMLTAIGLAEESDAIMDDGNPPVAPEFYLMHKTDTAWQLTVSDETIASPITDEYTPDMFDPSNDARIAQGADAVTWFRVDGMAQGTCTLCLTYQSGESTVFDWDIPVTVDEGLNVYIDMPMLLPANATTGYSWITENDPAKVELGEYITADAAEGTVGAGGWQPVTLYGTLATDSAELLYKRAWEEDWAILLQVQFTADDNGTVMPFEILINDLI